MEKLIFSDYGVEILERAGKLLLRYDAGELVGQMREDEITMQEAEKAMRSEKDAYEVILACQERLRDAGLDPNISNM